MPDDCGGSACAANVHKSAQAVIDVWGPVKADLAVISPDQVLHGGDLAANGARPAEVIDVIRHVGWRGTCGNTDEMLWHPELLSHLASLHPAKHGLRRVLFKHARHPRRGRISSSASMAWRLFLGSTHEFCGPCRKTARLLARAHKSCRSVPHQLLSTAVKVKKRARWESCFGDSPDYSLVPSSAATDHAVRRTTLNRPCATTVV
jgi:hypothetical protein